VQMCTDVQKHRNSLTASIAFYFLLLGWGCSPQTLANFCVQKFDKKLLFFF